MLAVATFADELSNRKVVLYSDNKGTQRVCLGRLCARVPSSFVQAPNTPLRRDLRRRSITTRSSMRSRDLFLCVLGICCGMHMHKIWTLVFKRHIHLWIERVPSKDNISDSPSRSEYEIMEDIGAQWRWPVLDDLSILPC